jgi:hypothetical protein
VKALALEDTVEYGFHVILIRDVATIGGRVATIRGDLATSRNRPFFVEIQNAYAGAACSKSKSDRPANTAAAAGNDCRFAVKTGTRRC